MAINSVVLNLQMTHVRLGEVDCQNRGQTTRHLAIPFERKRRQFEEVGFFFRTWFSMSTSTRLLYSANCKYSQSTCWPEYVGDVRISHTTTFMADLPNISVAPLSKRHLRSLHINLQHIYRRDFPSRTETVQCCEADLLFQIARLNIFPPQRRGGMGDGQQRVRGRRFVLKEVCVP